MLMICFIMIQPTIAQKGVSMTLLSPVKGSNIQSGMPFTLSFSIKNERDSAIYPPDSTLLQFLLNNQILSVGGVNTFYFEHGTLLKGDTMLRTFNFICTDQPPVNSYFCARVILQNKVNIDVNTANNTDCADSINSFNGIEERIASETLTVYPNPCTNRLYVKNLQTSHSHLALMDLCGRILKDERIENTEGLDISDLQTGMYFVAIYSEEGSKFISHPITINR